MDDLTASCIFANISIRILIKNTTETILKINALIHKKVVTGLNLMGEQPRI